MRTFLILNLSVLFLLGTKAAKNDVGKVENPKLLILMLDGFKWNYFARQKAELPGFSSFLEAGVQAEYVEPVFPPDSYPGYTTIGTGVYPETHGVVSNFMYDHVLNATFNGDVNNSTMDEHWWQNSEPIWITATKNEKRCFLRYWNRCDVPFEGILPEVGSGWFSAPGVGAINETLRIAVDALESDFDLVMVFGEHLDNTGHAYGPDSDQIKEALRQVDEVFKEFLDLLNEKGLEDEVNIIVIGDHGMRWVGAGSNVTHLDLGDYVDGTDIVKALERGGVTNIMTSEGRREHVFESLTNGSRATQGFDVYRKEDIPEEYHYKGARLTQDIVVVTRPTHIMRGLDDDKHIPRDTPGRIFSGVHGYANLEDMRTIFFARGPGFKKNFTSGPIELVDQYQVFAHLLQIPPRPNNGSWERVADMLMPGDHEEL